MKEVSFAQALKKNFAMKIKIHKKKNDNRLKNFLVEGRSFKSNPKKSLWLVLNIIDADLFHGFFIIKCTKPVIN